MNIEQMHYEVLEGKSDYMPLVIRMKPEGYGMFENPHNISAWESMHNPQLHIDTFLKNNENNLKLPTDRVIAIESNFLESLIPSMFGAHAYASPGGYIDVKPILDDIADFESLEIVEGQLKQAEKHLIYLKNNIPDNIHLVPTRFMSPLDYGVVMRGGDFYLDLLVEPELSMKFMEKIADLSIKTMKHFKDIIGEPYDKQVTVASGFWFHGTRLTGDSIVNVSPDVIKNMLNPIFNKFKQELGGVMLHYCCAPAPSGHVLPTLAECDSVRCVDNWQGYKTYFNENEDGMLQDKVSMFADFSFDEVSDIENFLKQDIFEKVKRKGGRGFVVRTDCSDLDKAKALYDKWQNYFVKKGMLYISPL